MKIAIPAKIENLDPHFGHCQYFTIYNVENNKLVSKETIQSPPHKPGLLPVWLKENNVTHVIAGGMGAMAKEMLKDNKINVFTGVEEKNTDLLFNDFINNCLNTTDTVCDHNHNGDNHGCN